MNSIRVFLMVFVMLLGAVCIATPTADTVENEAEDGWGITAGNTTYLDFPFTADGFTTTRDGLTLTLVPNTTWGDPDTSNEGAFVNTYGMDDKGSSAKDDLEITITGLVADTEYGIALSVKGYIGIPDRCDYTWGAGNQGGAVNEVKGVSGQENAVPLEGFAGYGSSSDAEYLFAVPLYKATSDATGTVKVWVGPADYNSTGGTNDSIRTQVDGLFVGTEIPSFPATSAIAWRPVPRDGATNVSVDTNLSWDPPSDANQFWTYDVYFGQTNPPTTADYLTTVSGAEPNVPNADIVSLFGTLSLGDYYWYVDSNDPNGQPTREGETWTFNAGVPLPTLVAPAIDADPNDLGVVLRWDSDDDSVNSGLIAGHRIVLTNIVDNLPAESFDKPASQEDYYLANPDLWDMVDYGQIYTWQVLELDAEGNVLAYGEEWPLRTKSIACTGLTAAADVVGGDCAVTLADLATMASAWLECGWQRPGGLAVPYPEKDPCNW